MKRTLLKLWAILLLAAFPAAPAFAAVTASLQVVARHENTLALDLSTPKDVLVKNIALSFTPGSGNNQVNQVWHDQRQLASAASEDLDLAGSLTSAFGATITFTSVKTILIQNLSTVRTLTVGGAAANAWYAWAGAATHTINIPPGGIAALSAPLDGYAVTAGTGDKLKILNNTGTTCDYAIWVVGVGS